MTPSYQKRNADAPLIRFLPAEHPSAQDQGAAMTPAGRSVSSEELRSFEHAAERLGTSLENLLLAGFASLLTRLTRQGVVAIAVGSNELAIFHLEEESPFQEVLDQCSKRKTLEESGPQSWDHGVFYEFLTDASAQPSPYSADCGLRLLIRENGLTLELGSPSGLWQYETLRHWLSHFFTLAAAGAAMPQTPVNRLPLWDESDGRRFYAAFNQTSMDFPGETSVVGRFAAQVKRRPDVAAVMSTGIEYTYRELDERSSELALRLIAVGAGPNRAVAVCMERSADLLLALLAVLKSGSFYVPLDPNNPSGRLQGILEECSPAALLSDTRTASVLERELKFETLALLRASIRSEVKSEVRPEVLPWRALRRRRRQSSSRRTVFRKT